ncbi:reverse transcriptase domain-containing protein [Tanacetum coccineum]|uniref:Reverse transcriptase domain-containing protein n=1 Tax=Tanacetum coccineum TaxID=301880 RepID=A0ABQ4XP76_9ASTR
MSGPESPPELRRRDKESRSEGNKLIQIFIKAEATFTKSPDEGVKRVMPENRETRPQKGSVVSFPFDNDHPTLAFISQTGNTSRILNIKPNERTNRSEKFRSCGFYHPLNDKVPYRQWDRNNDNQERNPLRMPEDGRSARISPADKTRESDESIQLSPISSEKDTHVNEKGKEKDELLEKSLKNKPPGKVVVHDDHPDQTITIEGNLTAECRSGLIKILRKHADAFAWTPADMTEIPRFVAEHELKTYPHIEPRVQRKRSIASDRRKVVKDEVAEWFRPEIVRKVRYPTWVANPVLVKKPDNSWRMCIDFKDLNKACPKYLYPLPEIDRKIESLMGFKYKCFLDAYKGYHQIQMAKKDEDKTAFHTDEGVFCYMKMPFGLKNARVTYQRLVDTIFEGKMGRNLEAYVDNMVIKSKTELEMIKDVEETLLTLKKVNMKLNPKKCSFGIEEEAEEAFQAMKKLIAKLLTLTAPKKEEELIVKQLAKWGVELEDYSIKYAPRSEIKGQVLADFLAETMVEDSPAQAKTGGQDDTLTKGEKPEEQEATKTKAPANLKAKTNIWKLYTNEASNDYESGAGLILIDLEGSEYSYALRLNFANSNNDTKYEALLAGLRIATKIKVEKMHAFVDSKLVANQVEGSYEAKGEKTKKYKENALEIIRSFTVQCEGLTKGVLIEELNERSVDTAEVNAIIEEATRTWMTPIQEYIEKGILSEDATEK